MACGSRGRPPTYTRTCAQCGTTWQVPRSAPRWRSRVASRFLAGAAVITGGLVEADPAAIARRSIRSRSGTARLRRATAVRNATLITSRSMHHAASCLTDNQPRCQLLLAGYLATCESTRSAGHRRPVPAPLPDRRAGGTAGSAGRGQGPAAHSARAARPALSHGADAGRAAGRAPAVAGPACRLPAAATAGRIVGRVRPARAARRGQQGYGGYAPQYQQPSGWQRSGGQGFLAGAGQIALGVGGGILAAEALGNLFSGDGLFGGDRDYGEREYDQGYYDGRQDEERQDDGGQDDGGQYDGDGG